MQEFCTIVEASGAASALEAALALITRTGRILVLGDYRDARADFRWLHLVHREIELIGSNASAGAWPEAVRLATHKEVPLEHLITHRFPAHRFEEAVALVRSRRSDVIKVVLEWE
jgi:L-gulonate 5-dehydrogenase